MAREKHIVDIKIDNFKCFADFEVKNLGQFNLIVGDNNTGKTSLLEALLFDEENGISELLERLYHTLVMRLNGVGVEIKEVVYDNFSIFLNKKQTGQHVSLSFLVKTQEYKFLLGIFNSELELKYLSELEKEKFFTGNQNIKEFTLRINNNVITSLQHKNVMKFYSPFVFFGLGYAQDLLRFYSETIDIKKQVRATFINNLKCLIPNVDDVRIGNGVINIYEENIDKPMPLYTYGEGANKLFRILCEIAVNQGKRLMIDEIDAGIHYSRFKDFWRTIMQAAKAYDVQIFATTHNQECMDYFRLVLEEEQMESYQTLARVVSLKALENNKIKARVYGYDDLKYANETNRELRGGTL